MESGNTSSKNNPLRAEEAIVGNTKVIQALKKFVTVPYLFDHNEAQKIGLLNWPTGLLHYGSPWEYITHQISSHWEVKKE